VIDLEETSVAAIKGIPNPGSGKSHLLTALAQELVVGRERKMHFTKCALLMQDLLAAKRDLRLIREIKQPGRYEGLIIDDFRVPTAEPG
jgi:DNA replication protein DnaC